MSRKSDTTGNLNRTWTLMPECEEDDNNDAEPPAVSSIQPPVVVQEVKSGSPKNCTKCSDTQQQQQQRRSIDHMVASSRLFLDEHLDKESFDMITKSIDSLFDRVNEWDAASAEHRQPGINDDWTAFDVCGESNFLVDFSACNSPITGRKNNLSPTRQQGHQINNVTIDLENRVPPSRVNETTVCLSSSSSKQQQQQQRSAAIDSFCKNKTFDLLTTTNDHSNVDDEEGMDVDDSDAEILLLSNKSSNHNKSKPLPPSTATASADVDLAADLVDVDAAGGGGVGDGGDLPKSFNASSIPKTFDLFLNDLKNSSVNFSRPTSPDRLLSSSHSSGGKLGAGLIGLTGISGAGGGIIANGLARCSVNMKVMTSSIDTDLNKAVSIGQTKTTTTTTTTNSNGAAPLAANPNLNHLNKENIKTSSPFQSSAGTTSSSSIPHHHGLNRSYTKEKPSSTAPTIAASTDHAAHQNGGIKLRNGTNLNNRKAFNSNESLSDYCDTSSRSSSEVNCCRDDNCLMNLTTDMIIGGQANHVNIEDKCINKTYEAGGAGGAMNTTQDMMACDYEGERDFEPVVFNTTYSSWPQRDQAETLSKQAGLIAPHQNANANTTMVLNKTQDLNNNSYHEPPPPTTTTTTITNKTKNAAKPASTTTQNELNKTMDIIDSDDLESNPEETSSKKKSSKLPSPSSQNKTSSSKLVRPNIEDPAAVVKPSASTLATRASILPSVNVSKQTSSKLNGGLQKQQSFPAPTLVSSASTSGSVKSPNTRLSLAPTSTTRLLAKQETSVDVDGSGAAPRPKSFLPKSRFGFQSVSSAPSASTVNPNTNNNSNSNLTVQTSSSNAGGHFKVPFAVPSNTTSPPTSKLAVAATAASRYSLAGSNKQPSSSVSSTSSLVSTGSGLRSPNSSSSATSQTVQKTSATTTVTNQVKSKLAAPSISARIATANTIPTSSSTSSIKTNTAQPSTSTSESKLAYKPTSPSSDNSVKSAINKPVSMIPSFKNSSSVQNFRYSTGYAIKK